MFTLSRNGYIYILQFPSPFINIFISVCVCVYPITLTSCVRFNRSTPHELISRAVLVLFLKRAHGCAEGVRSAGRFREIMFYIQMNV